MPTLAIVTLTRNEAKYIDEFIKCAQLCEPYEFIVVDDNSEDELRSIEEHFAFLIDMRIDCNGSCLRALLFRETGRELADEILFARVL